MPRNFKILHTQVGPYPRDRVVEESEMVERGYDINRLLRLQAIEKVSAPPTEEPLAVGPENQSPGEYQMEPPPPGHENDPDALIPPTAVEDEPAPQADAPQDEPPATDADQQPGTEGAHHEVVEKKPTTLKMPKRR